MRASITQQQPEPGIVRILMVCHGNICRSTMAEYVMHHLVAGRGLSSRILVDSAAATSDTEGWGVHEGTREVLARHGVPCGGHRARKMGRADYGRYDLICGMDEENLCDIYEILGARTRTWRWGRPVGITDAAEADPEGKVHLLLDWSDRPRAIADPWYTRDFEATYRDVLEGCEGLLAHLAGEGAARRA